MSGLVIGVDVGTQSVKAALFEAGGRCIGEHAVPLALDRRGAEEVEQDADGFVRAAEASIAGCMERSGCSPDDVGGVAVAGQMAGILGIGTDGGAVTPYDSWLDSRCSGEVAAIAEQLGDELVERVGCPSMVAHAPKILWWKHQHPDRFAKVEKWVVPSAYVSGRFCGLSARDAYVDWTHLHFSGLADAATSTWSGALLDELELDGAQLPRIVAPADIVGELRAEAARACGLRPGTPVAAGLGDTAAGALGAGIVAPGQVLDIAGTASVLGLATAAYRPDVATRTLLSMRGPVPGQWISLAYLAGGSLLRWLPQALAGRPAGDREALEMLLDEATRSALPERAGRPLFVPHLGGRILPAAPEARGSWAELDFSHERGDLARAVLESVAFEYAGFLDRALDRFPELTPGEVRVIGGGRSDALWNRIKASVLGLAYVRLEQTAFGCRGAALVAAAGCGIVDDLAAAALEGCPVAGRVEPDPVLHAIYAERLSEYRDLCEERRPLMVHA